MQGHSEQWLPEEGLFLAVGEAHVREHRPINQGDVFENVSIYLSSYKSGVAVPKEKPGHVMLIGNPCSLRGGSTDAIVQNVVQVRPQKEKELERFAPPWGSHWQLLPLPGLIPGQVWVADFNVIGSVQVQLLKGRRVACMSHAGMAALQRRYANHSLRIDQPLDVRMADTLAVWNELDVWEDWNVAGLGYENFQPWLNEKCAAGNYAGTRRRGLLEFAPDSLRAEFPLVS